MMVCENANHRCKYVEMSPLGIQCMGWELYHYDGLLRLEPKHECPVYENEAALLGHLDGCGACQDYLGQMLTRFLIEENATAMTLEKPLEKNFPSTAAYINWLRKPGAGRL